VHSDAEGFQWTTDASIAKFAIYYMPYGETIPNFWITKP